MSILTQELSHFNLKEESYGFLKFEFFKNERERKFNVKLGILRP